jgi:hypothetical protein
MIFPPATASVVLLFGVVDPIPTLPLLSITNALLTVDVVKFDGLEVAIKRFPAIERNVQGLEVAEPSVSASCGAVELEMVRAKRGEVVPIPTTAFTRLV